MIRKHFTHLLFSTAFFISSETMAADADVLPSFEGFKKSFAKQEHPGVRPAVGYFQSVMDRISRFKKQNDIDAAKDLAKRAQRILAFGDEVGGLKKANGTDNSHLATPGEREIMEGAFSHLAELLKDTELDKVPLSAAPYQREHTIMVLGALKACESALDGRVHNKDILGNIYQKLSLQETSFGSDFVNDFNAFADKLRIQSLKKIMVHDTDTLHAAIAAAKLWNLGYEKENTKARLEALYQSDSSLLRKSLGVAVALSSFGDDNTKEAAVDALYDNLEKTDNSTDDVVKAAQRLLIWDGQPDIDLLGAAISGLKREVANMSSSELIQSAEMLKKYRTDLGKYITEKNLSTDNPSRAKNAEFQRLEADLLKRAVDCSNVYSDLIKILELSGYSDNYISASNKLINHQEVKIEDLFKIEGTLKGEHYQPKIALNALEKIIEHPDNSVADLFKVVTELNSMAGYSQFKGAAYNEPSHLEPFKQRAFKKVVFDKENVNYRDLSSAVEKITAFESNERKLEAWRKVLKCQDIDEHSLNGIIDNLIRGRIKDSYSYGGSTEREAPLFSDNRDYRAKLFGDVILNSKISIGDIHKIANFLYEQDINGKIRFLRQKIREILENTWRLETHDPNETVEKMYERLEKELYDAKFEKVLKDTQSRDFQSLAGTVGFSIRRGDKLDDYKESMRKEWDRKNPKEVITYANEAEKTVEKNAWKKYVDQVLKLAEVPQNESRYDRDERLKKKSTSLEQLPKAASQLTILGDTEKAKVALRVIYNDSAAKPGVLFQSAKQLQALGDKKDALIAWDRFVKESSVDSDLEGLKEAFGVLKSELQLLQDAREIKQQNPLILKLMIIAQSKIDKKGPLDIPSAFTIASSKKKLEGGSEQDLIGEASKSLDIDETYVDAVQALRKVIQSSTSIDNLKAIEKMLDDKLKTVNARYEKLKDLSADLIGSRDGTQKKIQSEYEALKAQTLLAQGKTSNLSDAMKLVERLSQSNRGQEMTALARDIMQRSDVNVQNLMSLQRTVLNSAPTLAFDILKKVSDESNNAGELSNVSYYLSEQVIPALNRNYKSEGEAKALQKNTLLKIVKSIQAAPESVMNAIDVLHKNTYINEQEMLQEYAKVLEHGDLKDRDVSRVTDFIVKGKSADSLNAELYVIASKIAKSEKASPDHVLKVAQWLQEKNKAIPIDQLQSQDSGSVEKEVLEQYIKRSDGKGTLERVNAVSRLLALDGNKEKAITTWKAIVDNSADPEVLYQAVKCLGENLDRGGRTNKKYLAATWIKFVDAYNGNDVSKLEEAKKQLLALGDVSGYDAKIGEKIKSLKTALASKPVATGVATSSAPRA